MPWVIVDGKPLEVDYHSKKVIYIEHWVTAKDGSYQWTCDPERIFKTEEDAKHSINV